MQGTGFFRGAFRASAKAALKLFCVCGGGKMQSRDAFYMTPDEFVFLMAECGLINEDFNRRTAKRCAVYSMNTIIDNIKHHRRASAMTLSKA